MYTGLTDEVARVGVPNHVLWYWGLRFRGNMQYADLRPTQGCRALIAWARHAIPLPGVRMPAYHQYFLHHHNSRPAGISVVSNVYRTNATGVLVSPSQQLLSRSAYLVELISINMDVLHASIFRATPAVQQISLVAAQRSLILQAIKPLFQQSSYEYDALLTYTA
ncbi:hypothetical protein P153DRAFT_144341 [Dothidotthia symphoricarpi CBS 119687]|uniref:Uncharacterized protein n=1 Tax=Dothidotthia symphoricarpi CBS 119687 TaxID=1392245 RepID=A0A6A5ZWF9_9PLEO|nr:uncharacterized protein P153DRAFT_144341 [Dothidotthia symphoricarpi CBS 119687]KAF2124082.1 hypothetical protein P153DRAFT_144341 [Dothidotthia symphoricarpi CBS 119687]